MSAMPDAIVDSHHHLWDLSAGHYPWLQDAYDASRFILGQYRGLCKDYLPADLRRDIGDLPVVATVHVEAERDRAEALAETAWVDRMAREHGLPTAIVCWVDLLAADVESRLDEQLAFERVRGVRCKPRVARTAGVTVDSRDGSLDDPRWRRGLAALAERGLIWELRVPYWHLAEAARVIADVPALRVVVQHLGLPWDRDTVGLEAWRDGLRALAALPQVHLKLSELGLRDRPWRLEDNAPLIDDAIAIFRPDRVLFGSNFPVAGLRIGYRDLVSAMSEALAGRSSTERQAIWCDNANALYRLSDLKACTP
jgi:predicted TIM-barrel fold metal-dependent hydrolase